MELACYIVLFLSAVLLVLTGAKKDFKLCGVFWFILLLGFSVVVRQVPQMDMHEYYRSFRLPISAILNNAKQIKEINFWGPSSIMYSLLGGERRVLYVWDALVFFIVLSVRKRLHLGWYFVPFYFVAFPSVLGFQNVYRQFVAVSLVINATSFCLAEEKSRHWELRCVFSLIFAMTVHWSTVAVIPIVFFLFASIKKWCVLQWFVLIGCALASSAFLTTDLIVSTGLNLNLLYFLFLMALLALLMMQIRHGVDGLEFRGAARFIVGYVTFVATVGLVRLWGDLFYERLMLFFIPPITVLILWQVQKKAKATRIALLLLILLLLSLPSFLFSSSYAMMRNEEWLDWEMTN